MQSSTMSVTFKLLNQENISGCNSIVITNILISNCNLITYCFSVTVVTLSLTQGENTPDLDITGKLYNSFYLMLFISVFVNKMTSPWQRVLMHVSFYHPAHSLYKAWRWPLGPAILSDCLFVCLFVFPRVIQNLFPCPVCLIPCERSVTAEYYILATFSYKLSAAGENIPVLLYDSKKCNKISLFLKSIL